MAAKPRIIVTKTVVYAADLDVPPDATPDEIKAACEKLTRSDLWVYEQESYATDVLDGNGNDITGEVQPYTPNLNP